MEIIYKGACKVLGLLYRRFSTFCSSATLLYFCKSLFWLHLEYTSLARMLHILKDIREIEDVQKFAHRMITLRLHATYTEVLSATSLPTLERRAEASLLYLHKINHNLCYFSKNYISSRNCPPYRICCMHSCSLYQPFACTNSYLHSFLPSTIAVWNSLTEEIISASPLQQFKYLLSRCPLY